MIAGTKSDTREYSSLLDGMRLMCSENDVTGFPRTSTVAMWLMIHDVCHETDV